MQRSTIVESDIIPNGSWSDRPYTEALVIHHIGSPDMDPDVRDVDRWHKQNGWLGIGYNYLIKKDGTIERGRPRTALGAQCEGYNSYSIGIVVNGDFDVATPTEFQITSLCNLLADLLEIYDLSPDAILGHRDKCNTECPGTNLYNMLPAIKEKTKGLMTSV